MIKRWGESIGKYPSFWSSLRERLTGFFESISRKLVGKSEDELEKEVEKSLSTFGIEKSDDGFSELRDNLVDILSDQEEARKFFNWAKKSSSLLKGKIRSLVKDKKQELREEHEEREKELLIPTIRDAFNSEILKITDRVTIEILRFLKRRSNLQKIERNLDSNIEDIKHRLGWLKTLGVIEKNQDESPSGAVFYKISGFGEKVLKESSMHNQSPSWGKQLYNIAFAATGSDGDAEKLLNRLFGRWGRNHRSIFEKLDKKFGKSLEDMSKQFWEEMEGGHAKHIGIKIKNHEASGMLLCLRLSSFHIEERISGKEDFIGNRVFGKSNMGRIIASPA